MDTIQLTLDTHLKRTHPSEKNSFLKKYHLSEATLPLLVSYLTSLRIINGCLNKTDIIYQNEQKICEFKLLCCHNLLFFLTVTGQFDVIEKLFSTPSFATRLQHVMTLINEEHCKVKLSKKNHLLQLTHQQEDKRRAYLVKKPDSTAENRRYCFSCLMSFSEKSLNMPKDKLMNSSLTQSRLSNCCDIEIAGIPDQRNQSEVSNLLNNNPLKQQLTFFSSTEQNNKNKEKTFRSSLNLFSEKKRNIPHVSANLQICKPLA